MHLPGPAFKYVTQRDKINSVTNLAVSLISNTSQSTPRLALQIFMTYPPLDLIISYEALATLGRNRQIITKEWPGQNKPRRTLIGHILYLEKMAKSLEIDLESTGRIKMDMWNNKFTLHSVHEPLNLHDASSTGQIWTIDQIFLSIFPMYGVIYHAFIFGILDQSLHVFQNWSFQIDALPLELKNCLIYWYTIYSSLIANYHFSRTK